jgi:hypothetical protein
MVAALSSYLLALPNLGMQLFVASREMRSCREARQAKAEAGTAALNHDD